MSFDDHVKLRVLGPFRKQDLTGRVSAGMRDSTESDHKFTGHISQEIAVADRFQ
jgi:hypothetical protein